MPRLQHKTGTVAVSVDYEYDIHNVVLSKRTFDRIEAGESITKKGQGFPVEGECEQDWWIFNAESRWSIEVNTDQGWDIYRGSLTDAKVWVRVQLRTNQVYLKVDDECQVSIG
jgi:hypothetical protein